MLLYKFEVPPLLKKFKSLSSSRLIFACIKKPFKCPMLVYFTTKYTIFSIEKINI